MKAAFKNSPDLAKGYSLKVDPTGLKNLSDLMVAAGQITAPVDWAKVWISSTCQTTHASQLLSPQLAAEPNRRYRRHERERISVDTQGIQIENVSVVFDAPAGKVTAVKDITQRVPHTSFVSIVGPSGCGKSTLLAVDFGPAEGHERFGQRCR